MKRAFAIMLSLFLMFNSLVLAQEKPNRYEVELFKNPNPGRKDTREVNAIVTFGPDALTIQSRRNSEVFKVFKYSDIRSAEHTYTKRFTVFNFNGTSLLLTALTGLPIFIPARKEKHWLTITSNENFAVLKIENDNFRMIRSELKVKKIEIVEVNEDRK